MNEQAEAKSMWQQFVNKWLIYPADDPAVARKGFTLSVITMAFSALTLIAALVSILAARGWSVVLIPLVASIVFTFLYFLTRQGYLRLAAILVVIATGLSGLDFAGDNFAVSSNLGFLVLAVTILLSALLIGPKAMFITAGVVGVISAYSIVSNDNSAVAPAVSMGMIYLGFATVTYFLQQTQNILAETRKHSEALEEVKDKLQLEVAGRTRDLQTSFDLTNQVSNIIVASRNRAGLFEQTARLIGSTFHLSHVFIYSTNSSGGELTLQYGVDSAGRSVPQRHNLEIGLSVVGQAIVTRQPVIVNDLSKETQIAPNPFMPDTGAEMAIPIKKDNEVIGILDLHSPGTGSFAFTKAHGDLMQLVANQLTVALDNFQLLDELQNSLENVEALNQKLVQEKWDQALTQKQITGYVYTPLETQPLYSDSLAEVNLAIEPDVAPNGDGGSVPEMTVPVKLRGQTLGFLSMSRDDGETWSEDELLIMQTIVEQIGLALDSARLFEDTQRSAWRDQVVSESTAQVWSSTEIDQVMKAAVAQLGDKLQASEVVIRLGTEDVLGQE